MTTKEQKRFELIAEYAGMLKLQEGLYVRDVVLNAVYLADEVMKHYPEEEPKPEISNVMSARELLARMRQHLKQVEMGCSSNALYLASGLLDFAKKEVFGE